MGIINFIITSGTEEHVFNKNTFKYMYTSYSSGDTGSIYIYFQAENNLIDHDTITLTVNKYFMPKVVKDIAEKLNNKGFHEIRYKQSSGVYRDVTNITYTAG